MLTRSRRVSMVCGVTAVACAASTLLSQPDRPQDKSQDRSQEKLVFAPVRASEVMSAADRQRTGVDRLTPEQQFALDVWLTRYSAEIRGSAPPQPQQAIGRTVFASSAVDAAATEPTDETMQPRGGRYRDQFWTPLNTVPPAARLVSAPDDGSFVRLADGTLWEVYPPDRTSTDEWHPGDYVTVSLASTAVGDFDHVLVDTNANTRAHVRFVDVVGGSRRR
jgi:hypothetical protein